MSAPFSYHGKPLVYEWTYHAMDGAVLGHVRRYQNGLDKKDIIPYFKRKGGGFVTGFPEGKRHLFGLDKLASHSKECDCFIVEGEKKAAALHSLGFVALTSSGGCGAAKQTDWAPLDGYRKVYILPDNDKPGEVYARDVYRELSSLPHPLEIKVLRLPDLPDKGDIVDWLQTLAPDWEGYDPFPDKDWASGEFTTSLKNAVEVPEEWNKVAAEDKSQKSQKSQHAPGGFDFEPEPLRAPIPKAKPFPVEALGNVLGAAAIALHETIKAPLTLCCQCVLASASLAAQAHFNVLLPWNDTDISKPLSLYFLTVGESGERKTAVDDVVLSAARKQERQDNEQHTEDMKVYEAELAQWKENNAEAIKLTARVKDQKTSDLAANAKHNAGAKPEAPISPLRFVSDPTIEGLFKLLATGQPSVGLFSDEGGLFIGGHALNQDNALKTLSRLSKFWDAAPFDRVRGGDGSSVLYDRRLSLHLMAQPDVMAQLLNNPMANAQGFLSRCLVAYPESTIGTRFITEFVTPSSRSEVKRLFAKLKILTEAEPATGKNKQALEPVGLILSSDAIPMACDAYNQFEKLMGTGYDLADLRDRTSKAVENACRIAGNMLAVEEGLSARFIDAAHFNRGVIIMRWYLEEWIRIKGMSVIPQEVYDAESLLKWLNDKGYSMFRTHQILNKGPNQLRNKPRLEAAIKPLVDCGYIALNKKGALVDGVYANLSWTVK